MKTILENIVEELTAEFDLSDTGEELLRKRLKEMHNIGLSTAIDALPEEKELYFMCKGEKRGHKKFKSYQARNQYREESIININNRRI
jgi:hypothetical protein